MRPLPRLQNSVSEHSGHPSRGKALGGGARKRRCRPGAAPRGSRQEREPGPVLDVGNMNDWQRKSPLDWETYVNKLVKVVAVEKHEYEGWVLTVDPVSATIVLATFPENEKGSISFVMGHAIQEVEILQEGDSDMKQRLARISAPEESQAYSPEELEKRKNALKTWLETNHIPVGEQGELGRTLSVAGVLTIEPPYGPEQCSSANEIILARLQGLLQGYLEQQR
ncbi:gem-associated protein 6 isoform X2 [Parus major]|uniref:gem-associated protein 6 isoform X2 n=1 Tax=Parus major TaxID=9157 RepID=UPI0010877A70|nr:gem-associated protein 6 isoform X2 [Parus major]